MDILVGLVLSAVFGLLYFIVWAIINPKQIIDMVTFHIGSKGVDKVTIFCTAWCVVITTVALMRLI